jgi:hypothetical protein
MLDRLVWSVLAKWPWSEVGISHRIKDNDGTGIRIVRQGTTGQGRSDVRCRQVMPQSQPRSLSMVSYQHVPKGGRYLHISHLTLGPAYLKERHIGRWPPWSISWKAIHPEQLVPFRDTHSGGLLNCPRHLQISESQPKDITHKEAAAVAHAQIIMRRRVATSGHKCAQI